MTESWKHNCEEVTHNRLYISLFRQNVSAEANQWFPQIKGIEMLMGSGKDNILKEMEGCGGGTH